MSESTLAKIKGLFPSGGVFGGEFGVRRPNIAFAFLPRLRAKVPRHPTQRIFIMLLIIAVVLVGFWLLGLVFRIAGGFIHLLLVIAVVVVIYSLISGHSAGP